MKIQTALLLTFIAVSFATFGQRSKWLVELSPNFDIYKPYTPEAQALNKSIRSYTGCAFVERAAWSNSKWSWSTGLSFKMILHLVDTAYYDWDDNQYLNLKSNSFSIGWSNDINLLLEPKNDFICSIGVRTNLYLFEYYNSHSYTPEGGFSFHYTSSTIYTLPRTRMFEIACSDLSIYYRMMFNANRKLPIGFTASLSTNLYSDWDQFSRYAWIGLGVDMGFGKKLAAKETKQP